MRKIQLPMDDETIMSLKCGEEVLLSGIVYTARDAAHKRMKQAMDEGKPLPFDLHGAAIYYAGPAPARPGQAVGSAGPTTSGRMDTWTPELLDKGLKVMIGKGRRSKEVKDAMVRNHAVYLAAVGGAGALLSHCIISAEVTAYEDLLSEAVRKLEVKDFPCFVAIDACGKDIYE